MKILEIYHETNKPLKLLPMKTLWCINIKIKWRGKGVKEVGYNSENNKILVRVDPGYFRPTDIDELRGDSTKARKELGWRPTTTFKELVKKMGQSDIQKYPR